MTRIRHIAIATRDPEATARFYMEGLGLKEVGKVNTPTSEGFYLSDGHVNLAILKFKYDDPATTEGTLRYTGLHHFGVEVEDMAEGRRESRRRVRCTVLTRERKRWLGAATSRSSSRGRTA
jgi:catechol 2,3-dioxygenase-like lactoylglutathione lyase family enzyme